MSEKNKKKDYSDSFGIKLIQHKHCTACGKAIRIEDQEYCSSECKNTLDANIKKKRNYWIYMAILGVALLFIWFMAFFIN